MAFNLEKVQFVLEKREINNIPCNVEFGIDASPSAVWLYENGTIKNVFDRIYTIAMAVDVDKKLGVHVFGENVKTLPEITESNVATYFNKLVYPLRRNFNGTRYAPVIAAIKSSIESETASGSLFGKVKTLFGGGKQAAGNIPPVLGIIITDGQNQDRDDAERVLKESQNLNIYWLLVGIGSPSEFKFIREMGAKYPNVGCVEFLDITKISEEDLYDQLLNDEFAAWVKRFK